MSAQPVIAQPDLEAWLTTRLGGIPGLTIWTVASFPATWNNWLYDYTVQIDARAKRKKAARDLAEHVRQAVAALPDQPWPDGVISLVNAVDGPAWLPDDDGAPRYIARYQIRVHPHRVTASPAQAAGGPRRGDLTEGHAE